MNPKILLMATCMLIVISSVIAQTSVNSIDRDRQDRIDFGHVLDVKSIKTEPTNLIPGRPAKLIMELENNAKFKLFDIRVKIKLPKEFALLEDLSQRKIASMESGEFKSLSFDIIALPNTVENVYQASFTLDYLNHVGTEKSENDTIGIIVKATPQIFAQIESSEIYKGNYLGDVRIKFVNNEVADVKFLTAELIDTKEFVVLSESKEYVGDLDSDDFETVLYRIKVLGRPEKVILPLSVTYKDTLNEDYSIVTEVVLPIRSAAESGVSSNNTTIVVVGIIFLSVIGVYYYRRKKKKREKY